MNDNISTFPLSSELKPLDGGSKVCEHWSEDVFDVSENTSASPTCRPSDQGLRSSMYEGLRSQEGERLTIVDNPQLGSASPTQRRQAAEICGEKIAFLGRQ